MKSAAHVQRTRTEHGTDREGEADSATADSATADSATANSATANSATARGGHLYAFLAKRNQADLDLWERANQALDR